MKSPLMQNKKPLRIILIVSEVCLGLLLLTGTVFYLASPSPVEAAKAGAVSKGWSAGQLGLHSTTASNFPFGGSAHVEFDVTGQGVPKLIRLDLVRSAFSLNWRVSAYHEVTPKRE